MGFFSWITQDTNRSIHNKFTKHKPFTVIMTDNKGNRYVENDYEGYGVFGGKDYYDLTAEMNGMTEGTLEEKRNFGITLRFGVAAIRNRKTGEVIHDFFSWAEPLVDGMSANELIETDDWDSVRIKFQRAIFPSLTESGDYMGGESPKDCPHQGYFM